MSKQKVLRQAYEEMAKVLLTRYPAFRGVALLLGQTLDRLSSEQVDELASRIYALNDQLHAADTISNGQGGDGRHDGIRQDDVGARPAQPTPIRGGA